MIAKLIMKYCQLIFHPVTDGRVERPLIKKIFGIRNVFCSDEGYWLPRQKDIESFLKLNVFKFRQYVPELYDCDNYSFSLIGMFTNLMSGYAIGIVWVHTPKGNHALNFFIDHNREVWYIEPQTDRIFKNKDYKPYFVVM